MLKIPRSTEKETSSLRWRLALMRYSRSMTLTITPPIAIICLGATIRRHRMLGSKLLTYVEAARLSVDQSGRVGWTLTLSGR